VPDHGLHQHLFQHAALLALDDGLLVGTREDVGVAVVKAALIVDRGVHQVELRGLAGDPLWYLDAGQVRAGVEVKKVDLLPARPKVLVGGRAPHEQGRTLSRLQEAKEGAIGQAAVVGVGQAAHLLAGLGLQLSQIEEGNDLGAVGPADKAGHRHPSPAQPFQVAQVVGQDLPPAPLGQVAGPQPDEEGPVAQSQAGRPLRHLGQQQARQHLHLGQVPLDAHRVAADGIAAGIDLFLGVAQAGLGSHAWRLAAAVAVDDAADVDGIVEGQPVAVGIDLRAIAGYKGDVGWHGRGWQSGIEDLVPRRRAAELLPGR